MNALDWQLYHAQRRYVAARAELLRVLMLKVILRDGSLCHYCHAPTVVGNGARGRTLDHVTPAALGGKDVLTNLVLACRSCNASKGIRPAHQLLRRAS